jgi:cytochrome c oxidase subunit 1
MTTVNQVTMIPQTVPFSETMSSNMPHDFEGNEEAIRIQEQWNKENNRVVEG